MRCPYCQNEHPDEARYCNVTGQPLPATTAMNAGIQPAPKKRPLFLIITLVAGLLILIAGGVVLLLGQNFLDQKEQPAIVAQAENQETPVQQKSSTPWADALTPEILESAAQDRIANITSTPMQKPAVSPIPDTPTPGIPSTATPTSTAEFTPTQTLPPKPFGGWITYAYGEDNAREIFILNPDTAEQKQITSNYFRDEAPCFSPDNQYLVYSSYRDAGWEIYLYDFKAGTEKQLTQFNGQARYPEWSPVPGDQRIIFEGRSGTSGNLRVNIWIMDSTGGQLEQLTSSDAESRPVWMPDGAKIVFGRALKDTTGDGLIRSSDFLDIYIYDFATKDVTRVKDSPGEDDFQFAVSPDNYTIAYTSVRADVDGNRLMNLDDAQDLYTIGIDGQNDQHLDMEKKHIFSPDWSPDGARLVFTVDIGSGRQEMWIYRFDTGELKQITEGGPYYHPSWAK